jgi:hypothetical protein
MGARDSMFDTVFLNYISVKLSNRLYNLYEILMMLPSSFVLHASVVGTDTIRLHAKPRNLTPIKTPNYNPIHPDFPDPMQALLA